MEGTEHNIRESEESGTRKTKSTTSRVVDKESSSALEIVELIMDKLRGSGKFFMLPMNDCMAMEAITIAFRLLLDYGKVNIILSPAL